MFSDENNVHVKSDSLVPVVHVCHNVAQAVAELPLLLAGTKPKPASGLGSQSDAIPAAIIVGGGFAPENFDLIRAACDPVKPMPWFRTIPKGGPPPPDVLVQVIRSALDSQFKEKGKDGVEPGVYEN